MNRTVKQCLNKFFASSLHASALIDSNEIRTHYYKLPFVGPFSTHVQRRIKNLTQRYCKNLDIKLVFAPYKIKNLFSAKDAISKLSRSRVVYKFSCAGCSACYVETNRHLATRYIYHLIRTRISFSTLMDQKHADLYAQRIVFQSLTPPPRGIIIVTNFVILFVYIRKYLLATILFCKFELYIF